MIDETIEPAVDIIIIIIRTLFYTNACMHD